MIKVRTVSMVLAGALSAGLGGGAAAQDARRDRPAWRDDATVTDQVRIDQWRDALFGAVKFVETQGFTDAIRADSLLFEFGGQEAQRPIPDGLYSCASTQMNKAYVIGLAFISYPPFRCQVETRGGVKSFRKLTGSQRTIGRLYPASDTLGEVYLGTWQSGDERAVVPYATETGRNDPAVLQSMEGDRWRMIFPGGLTTGTLAILDVRPVSD